MTGRGAPPVGLIVNPCAGRDVRRLVAPAGNVGNHDRVTLIRRLLGGLLAAGVREVLAMPEPHGLALRAAEATPGVCMVAALARASATPADTTRAAEAMAAAGVGVIVTLGGDGTSRLAALGAGETPLLPIPGGTNNAFAAPVESTAAGLAAGLVALMGWRVAARERCIRRRKVIRASVASRTDLALVDAVVARDRAIGARALWEPSRLHALLVTQAHPGVLGLSSLAAALLPVAADEPCGAYVEMGAGTVVSAILAPGVVGPAEVRAARRVPVGEAVAVGPVTGTLCLDGERTWELRGETARLAVEAGGPWVVDVPRALAHAQEAGCFAAARRPPAESAAPAPLAG